MTSWLLSLFLAIQFTNASQFMASGHGAELRKSPRDIWPYHLTVKFFTVKFTTLPDTLGVQLNEAFEANDVTKLSEHVVEGQTIQHGTPFDEHYLAWGEQFQLVSGVYGLVGTDHELQQLVTLPKIGHNVYWFKLTDIAQHITTTHGDGAVLYWNACRGRIDMEEDITSSSGVGVTTLAAVHGSVQTLLEPVWDARAIVDYRIKKYGEYCEIAQKGLPFFQEWQEKALIALDSLLAKKEREREEGPDMPPEPPGRGIVKSIEARIKDEMQVLDAIYPRKMELTVYNAQTQASRQEIRLSTFKGEIERCPLFDAAFKLGFKEACEREAHSEGETSSISQIVGAVYHRNDHYREEFTKALLVGGFGMAGIILIFAFGLVCGMIGWWAWMQLQRKDLKKKTVDWRNVSHHEV
eukprot:434914_1